MSTPTTRKRGFLTWFFASVGVLVVLAVAVGLFYDWRVRSMVDQVGRSDTLLPAEDDRLPSDAAGAGALNFALMGSDARSDDERGRSDVLMLAHVPPSRDRVYLISFPRDMWVDIPDRGYAKINAAYAWGGDQLAVRTLESLVGVRIDHVAKINFEGFIGLTTALDGVAVYNRVASRSPAEGYVWPEGEITLEGEEALTYVRQRYELPDGDLARAERQRAVVKAILAKMMSTNVIANPLTFNEVMGELGQYVTVDSALTNEMLLSMATQMRVSSSEDIKMLQAPISGLSTSADGQSIDIVDEAQLEELSDALRNGWIAGYYDDYHDQPFAGR